MAHQGRGPILACQDLPARTRITFVSELGNLVIVDLLLGTGRSSYGLARQVQVVKAPRKFTGNSVRPTQMVCVGPGHDVRIITDAYGVQKADIERGDRVYLVDIYDGDVAPMYFVVAEVSYEAR
jgi:hypothetical protein